MSSGGSRNVWTHPVLRSISKVDVVKNSLSKGQVTRILVLPVPVSNQSLITSLTQLLFIMFNICTTSLSTASNVFLACCELSILMPCGVILGIGNCPLP